jgi:PAS domain S-box-containing protein
MVWETPQKRVWEAMPIPVLIADAAAVIQWANPAFIKISGYSGEEIAGQSLRALRRDPPGAVPFEETWRAVMGGDVRSVDTLHDYRSGTRAAHETWVPLPGPGGVIDGVVVMEAERRESLLQTALEATTEGVLVLDRAGRTVGYSRRFLEMWHLQEAVVREGGNALLQSMGSQLKAPEKLLAQTDPGRESQDELECADGRVLEWYRRPRLVEGGANGVVWSFRDITGRRRAEEQARHLNETIERQAGDRTSQLARTVEALRNEIGERLRIEGALRESEERMRLKLDSVFSPDSDIGEQDLENILDIPALQPLMEDVTRLTGMVTAILNLKGKILVATGWQPICTQFHRLNPETSRNCAESDLFLANNVRPGEYIAYKCKNLLWDVVTPLFIGEKYVGNIYTGQFFYDDEVVDTERFRQQAARCGMDQERYLQALAEVPRVSRQRVKNLMDFLARFAAMISRIGYGNLKLARAISRQQQADMALRESEERFRLLVARAPVPISIGNERGQIEYVNDRFRDTFGYSLEDIPDTATWFARAYPDQEYRASVLDGWMRRLETSRLDGEIAPQEFRVTCKDGSCRTVEIFGTQAGDRLLILFNDVSERKRSEQEHARLEEQLRQAQKMEAVGRLAGGVAHDFNNLLTVINGYSSLALGQLPPGSPMRPELEEIHEAGERAADLTRQLLAFSRKQVTQPSILNLNDNVRNASQMLRRIIGEDVELVCQLDAALWSVKADGGQLHQVLMNLAVNARDAMPDGGKLVIETRNLEYDGVAAAPTAEMPPGAYVMLSVGDSGTGMSEEVKQHLFEPFFTTKEMGKGTGLGLAMVFGIVQHSGGHIWAESLAGHGSTIRICLPRVEAPARETVPTDGKPDCTSGLETVLVVEDQPEVLKLACAILKAKGYRVLSASGGEDALRQCEAYPDPVHAMITDVVMPHMSGWELASRVTALRPKIRVLFMSGYTGKVPVQEALGNGAVEYIQKPFSPETLAAALRRSLDRPRE